MFDSLSDRLSGVFDSLRGRGALQEDDVRAAMREVRIALLEADVALPVVRRFIDKVTEQAIGQQVLRSVTPGQQVVKIVNDALVEMLGGGDAEGEGADTSALNLDAKPPVVIMMVGLQGSGKTTSTAKIAKRLREKEGKKVMMASLDVNRPAAQEQLAVLGTQADVATLPIIAGQQPVDIATRALQAAKLQSFDVLMLDTAGRLHVDEALMAEMKAVAAVSAPKEVLLVVDALTGQDAVNVAQSFTGEVPLTGVVLTRMDGDARGGATRSPASRSSLRARAKNSTRSRRSILSVSPIASSAWATSFPSSKRRRRASRRRTPNGSPAACRRASSTSTICACSCSR